MYRNELEGWYGQYCRMLRWKDRVTSVYGDSEDAETIFDFAYAFFQNSYHLGDWLISDDVVPEEEIETFRGSTSEMKLCRDICNTTKHKKYNQGFPSIDATPMTRREYDPFSGDWHGWYLYSDKRRPIVDLISDCAEQWRAFLDSKDLL